MKNLKMFCLTLEPNHYNSIKELGYTPVGLGDKQFDSAWFTDKTGSNISEKNKNYGEYTFHYWIWKNYLHKLDKEWVGFCQYRKFWTLNKQNIQKTNFNELNSNILKEVPENFNKFESILIEPIFINQFRLMKFLKKGFKIILKNPFLLINKKKRNIRFHFDLMHGEGNLNKAIDLLDVENRESFKNFVNNNSSFNPHNMFICKSQKVLKTYYDVVFPWLEQCENIFGFENLKGYGGTRMYGFLAERFMSYWFQKNTKYTTVPFIYYDIGKS